MDERAHVTQRRQALRLQQSADHAALVVLPTLVRQESLRCSKGIPLGLAEPLYNFRFTLTRFVPAISTSSPPNTATRPGRARTNSWNCSLVG